MANWVMRQNGKAETQKLKKNGPTNVELEELLKIFFVIVRSYLQPANLRDALLLNFASMPLTIQRVGSADSHHSLHRE